MKPIGTKASVTASRRDIMTVSTDDVTWRGEVGVLLGGQCPLPALFAAGA